MNQEERLTFIAISSTYPILLIFELFSLRITLKILFSFFLCFSFFLNMKNDVSIILNPLSKVFRKCEKRDFLCKSSSSLWQTWIRDSNWEL